MDTILIDEGIKIKCRIDIIKGGLSKWIDITIIRLIDRNRLNNRNRLININMNRGIDRNINR